MPRLALLLVLGLVACSGDGQSGDAIPVEGWRTERGAIPTRAEFTALTATCEVRGGALDSCLADMGLRRNP